MSTQSTPGPWTVFFVDQVSTIVPSGRPGEVADNICNAADARLIAAAPDMLAALKQLDAVTHKNGVLDDARRAELNAAFKTARVAIAKAEGRS